MADNGAKQAPDIEAAIANGSDAAATAAPTTAAPSSSSSAAAASSVVDPFAPLPLPLRSLSAAQQTELDWLRGLIGLPSSSSSLSAPTLRISLHDGRVYTGRLHCIDDRANIILTQAYQQESVIDDVIVGGYAAGQVLVAWKLIKKVEQEQLPTQQQVNAAAPAIVNVAAPAATVQT